MPNPTLQDAVSIFGAACKAKLSNKAAKGQPEDQLRGPLENLFKELAVFAGLPEGALSLVGENTISELRTRPDYAVTVQNALVGFIEVKAPGKGADPRRFTDEHDKKQWAKLKSLPNLLYTDGNAFSLWRNGELQDKVVVLDGDVETSGNKLSAPSTLLPIISDFLQWAPVPPRTARQLAEISARLCRLLRDEVAEELEHSNPGLTSLADEWRGLLFPGASNVEFADGYAQAVTFGLLVARARDIALQDGIENAALELRKSNSLIGTALRLLTDSSEVQKALDSALRTLARVLDAVDWSKLTKDSPEAWIYFYEHFLEVYDNKLRKRTGSYYTPPEVVTAMVRLVDEALRDPALFALPRGLASPEVTLADPAVGTGAYLLGALRSIAKTVEEDMGVGVVPGEIVSAAKRLVGFEMQFGPYAVAQLRLLAEMQTLMNIKDGDSAPLPELRLFITNTLGDPFADGQFSTMTQPIGESRKQANAIKRGEPITVVIGNPPYKEKAKGRGGWVEQGSDTNKLVTAPMQRWTPPKGWGVSAHAKHLKNLYVYFWRWATLKVFGSGWYAATGEADTDRAGIICYITVAGFLNGPGFQKMRDDLRRDCSDIWVIDCSPEGHQPDVASRIFQGVQQPVCIVLAARTKNKDRTVPAKLHFLALPKGKRDAKFDALTTIALRGGDWIDGPSGWREPFLPARAGSWEAFAALDSMFVYDGSGVMPGRTWVIAPDKGSLAERWDLLKNETDAERREILFHPHEGGDKTSTKATNTHLFGHERRVEAVYKDKKSVIPSTRYAFRSFDRQWIIPDNRLLNRPNPTLWDSYSNEQIFITSPEDRTPENGPAITLSELIPDLHHYNGRGGRVFPLWRNAEATLSNIKVELLAHLSTAYGFAVGADEVMAYIAALLAQPAFTARFKADLVRPGLRVPITADAALFREGTALGREVIWLHCYGERFADPANNRPAGPPRLPKDESPTIPMGGAIPGKPESLPEDMDYDPTKKRLHIGKGYIDNVPKAVWDYEVSGKQVLVQWFSYRRLDRSRPIIGDRRPPSPLDKIQPDHWLGEYTSDLMNLLHVLGRLVKLEPAQADLLQRICAAPLLPSALPEPPPLGDDGGGS
ncbi:MAG: N-6 DNA methylase [Methylobacterium sp.]|nr:N-6 DNA methylase [Methylobacterium sp.]